MIIGTCGFCSTGSSAVSDYLAEFDENQLIDDIEFTFAYLPDGLEDLEYHLTKNISRDDSCCMAITRFRNFIDFYKRSYGNLTSLSPTILQTLTNEFLDSIVQMRWRGTRRSDVHLFPTMFYRYVGRALMCQRIMPRLNKKAHRCVDVYPYRTLEMSIQPSNFQESARLYINNILSALGADFTKNIVLDQPFTGDDPIKSFHFFDNPVAIVVDRDPRDNYIFAREFLYKKGKFMPADNVEEFVQYYRLMRDNRPYKLSDERILRLQFEELVYDYDSGTEKIRRFCNLPENPRPRSIFDPSRSINNTQLILKFPQYADDVKYIEDNLSEYLFDFSRFPKPDNSGKMFMGKSELNVKKK